MGLLVGGSSGRPLPMLPSYTPPSAAELDAVARGACAFCFKCNAGKICARPGCNERLEHGKIYGQGFYCHRNKCTEAAGVVKCKKCKFYASMPVARLLPMPQQPYMNFPMPTPPPTD